jgi:hypothetical protein
MIVMLGIITNRHDPDPTNDVPTLLLAKQAAAAKVAAKAPAPHGNNKPAAAAKAQPKPVLTEQQRVEMALRANLDKTAKSLGSEQLQPLLMHQGHEVLHSKKLTVSKGGDGLPNGMTASERSDLHSALKQSSRSESQATENSLRTQLNNKLKAKEQAMFRASLKTVSGGGTVKSQLSFSPTSSNNDKPVVAPKAPSEQDEEDVLKEQLNADVKNKEKTMFKQAFKSWNEKQHNLQVKKAVKHSIIVDHEKKLFEETLKHSKDTNMLADKHSFHTVDEAATGGSGKPGFKTWLKAFKTQLSQRANAAQAKMVEGKYKAGARSSALHAASTSRSKSQTAVLALQKSLALERKEEKEVRLAESKQEAPGKALAQLKQTMLQERAALKTIRQSETGAGADPNLAALAPKLHAKGKKDDSLLGLDDIDYM